MYQKISIKNFKCFSNLIIEKPKRVNLFVGLNNIGKTACLEAIYLLSKGTNISKDDFKMLILRPSFPKYKRHPRYWGISFTENPSLPYDLPWISLFHEFDTSKYIELKGRGNSIKYSLIIKEKTLLEKFKKEKQLSLSAIKMRGSHKQEKQTFFTYSGIGLLQEAGFSEKKESFFATIYIPARIPIPPAEDADRFSSLELAGKTDVLLKAMKTIEPRLNRLFLVSEKGTAILFGEISNLKMPLSLMGEGMVRLASIILAIGNAENGIVLIDEIENGIHYSVLENMWKIIAEAAELFNAQVFATTHSRECAMAAHVAFSQRKKEGKSYDFKLFRLERATEKEIEAVAYDEESLQVIYEEGWEVR